MEIAIGQHLDVSPRGVKDNKGDRPIEGVELERLSRFSDHRGTLGEVIDFRRPFWREPVVYSYVITVRPGRIKGWGMHKLQADRYYVASGHLRVVLYDGRTESPSHGQFQEIQFSPETLGLVRIPPGVWHADQNWGDVDAMILNFPTRPYSHENPDKYRIDPHSGAIPFDFALADY